MEYIEQFGMMFPIVKICDGYYNVTMPDNKTVSFETIAAAREYIETEYSRKYAGADAYKIEVTDKFSRKKYTRMVDNSTLQYARDVLADMVRRARLFAVDGTIYRIESGLPYLVETAVYLENI